LVWGIGYKNLLVTSKFIKCTHKVNHGKVLFCCESHVVGAGLAREQQETGIGFLLVPEQKIREQGSLLQQISY
jgi:hypothetical protein